MVFNPKINDKLKIGTEIYRITEHPAAKGMPYGQAGRRATVYQLATPRNEYRALKVFNAIYRSPDTRIQAEQLSKYAMLPGMVACKRIVLSPEKYPDLRSRFKSLQYAVIMPWVEGTTWQELLMNKQVLSKEQCIELADGFLQTLVNMEYKGIAHCDLSGPNLIIDLRELQKSNGKIDRFQPSLIDLEELYGPGFSKPKKVPAGSAGYAHKTVKNGVWSVEGDRFAGSILLANILTWFHRPMLEASYGEHFFDPIEIHTYCHRYEFLSITLKNQYGKDIQNLFDQAWFSETLRDCPLFSEWASTLNVEIERFQDEPAKKPSPPISSKPQMATIPPKTSTPVSKPMGGPVTGWISLSPSEGITRIPAPKPVNTNPHANQDNFWEWDTPQHQHNPKEVYSIDYSPSGDSERLHNTGTSTTNAYHHGLPQQTINPTSRNFFPSQTSKFSSPPKRATFTPKPVKPVKQEETNDGITDGEKIALGVFLVILLLTILILLN